MNKQIQFKIKSIKTKLIFGFIVLFTLLECNLLYANGAEVEIVQLMQQNRISLNIQGKPLKEILTELEKVSGLNFIINDDIQISTLNNLSINVNNFR